MNAKNVAMMIAIMLVAIPMASAVNVDCGSSSWWNPFGNYCEDNELQSEFDEVTEDINEVDNYVAANEAAWVKDSSGTSMGSVRKYIYGDFIDFLRGLFVTRTEFDALEDRMYEQESRFYFMENDITYSEMDMIVRSAYIEIQEKNVSKVQHGDYTCSYEYDRMTCLRSI